MKAIIFLLIFFTICIIWFIFLYCSGIVRRMKKEETYKVYTREMLDKEMQEEFSKYID